MRRHSPRQLNTPDIVAGRRVRRIEIEAGPGAGVLVLEAADADVVIDEALAEHGDPYAAVLWPSALAAAAHLAGLLAPGDRVLDIGAGTGVVALVAARLGARATALDHDPFSRAVIAAAASAQSLDVEIIDFDVRSDDPLPACDIAVMADLLYEPELARAAARRTLETLAARRTVLVADPARYGRAEYERLMADAGAPVAFTEVLVPVPGEAAAARVGLAVLGQRQP